MTPAAMGNICDKDEIFFRVKTGFVFTMVKMEVFTYSFYLVSV